LWGKGSEIQKNGGILGAGNLAKRGGPLTVGQPAIITSVKQNQATGRGGKKELKLGIGCISIIMKGLEKISFDGRQCRGEGISR